MAKGDGKKRTRNARKRRELEDYMLDSNIDFMRTFADTAKDSFKQIDDYLESVIDGNLTETKMTARGDKVKIPLSHETRLKACKLRKELLIDKMISDRKDTGRDKDKGKGASLEEVLAEIERVKADEKKAKAEAKKKTEQAAEGDGKIVRLG